MAERLRVRLLAGLAYYPMLVLLLIVLALIHLTDWLGLAVASASLILAWALFWWSRLYAPKPNAPTIPLSLMWMSALAMSYGALHDFQTTKVRKQLKQWNQTNRWSAQDVRDDQTWNPVVLRGSIEQTLRYRRSTVPAAQATSDRQIDDWQTLTTIHVTSIQNSDSWSELSLDASLVIDGKLSNLYPGDSVQIYGHWRRPPQPSNPGQFDLRSRYAEIGIAAQIKSESKELVERISPGSRWRLDRWLAVWTQHALLAIDRYVTLEQAPLTAALVLGQREQADWEFQERMLATGTIHMLSISGMHIEMVALTLLVCGWTLRFPKSLVLLGTVCICTLYALLCGANPPVARATIMLASACFAKYLGWSFSSLNILAFAGLIILAQRTSVAFEVGTQLSFLTVAVLILTFPLLRRRSLPIARLIEAKETWLGKFGRTVRRMCWESLRSSFWVSFISAPLVWSSFHIISPISIALNLILWLPMLVALLAGLGLVLCFWIPPLAWFFGNCCGISLWFLSAIVGFAHEVPCGHFWAVSPPHWWLIGFYTIAFSISVWLGTRRSGARRTLLWALGSWFALGPLWILGHETLHRSGLLRNRSPLEITFIDVGHGTCVLIQTPDGGNWLYDAGRLGDHQRSYQPIAQSLWSMGVGRIDGMFLSHADSDHYNAMEGLLDRFSVERFITTQDVVEHPSQSIQRLLAKVSKQRIPIDLWSAGSGSHRDDSYKIRAIYPNRMSSPPNAPRTGSHARADRQKRNSDNARSLCLLIEFANRRILLPGDLESPGTESLISRPTICIDVLMAPHHGSLTSNQDGLIAWSQASTVVISGSHRSLDPRVFEVYSPHGQKVLHTACDHAIRLRIDPAGSMRWYQWQEKAWSQMKD